jgi:hypothetical protein
MPRAAATDVKKRTTTVYRSGKRSCLKRGSDFRRWNGESSPKSPIASAKKSIAPPTQMPAATSAVTTPTSASTANAPYRTQKPVKISVAVCVSTGVNTRGNWERNDRVGTSFPKQTPSATTPIVAALIHGRSHARGSRVRSPRNESAKVK